MMGYLNKINGSLAFRLPYLYRRLLRLKKPNALPPKKPLDIMVIMMTGRNFIDMTRLSVLSVAKSWSALPKLIISTDGSMQADELKKQLGFWPGELVVEDWQNTAAYHQHKNRPALVKYGNAHPFGKKLALIIRYAEQAPVIWLDSDILFFNDFIPYLPKPAAAFACGGTEDFTPAYHETVIKHTGNNLYDLYKFNAGLLYVSGRDIYETFNLEQLIEAIHPDYDFCTEQTIFAHIASKSLGIIWSKNIVKSFNADSQEIKAMPVKNIIARHYTSNVRHLFWRDAFFN
jgi:hypothetical protein